MSTADGVAPDAADPLAGHAEMREEPRLALLGADGDQEVLADARHRVDARAAEEALDLGDGVRANQSLALGIHGRSRDRPLHRPGAEVPRGDFDLR